MINSAEQTTTRERILRTALETFAELGFEGATTRTIAEAAGVNVGLIKYYFDSKARLWQESADAAFEELHDALGDSLEPAEDLPPEERLRTLAQRFVRFVSARPGVVRFMQDAGTHDGERMRWLVDRHLRPVYGVIRANIERLQDAGTFPSGVDPIHFFYLIVGATTLIFHQAPECEYLTGTDPRDATVADAHAEALWRVFSVGREATKLGDPS